jgi:adenylate cyclase
MVLAGLIGNSPAIRHVREQLTRLLEQPRGARLPPVLLEGETGTGKGLLVREMQREGPRRDGPFVDVNCAAIPETLLEAEMFGFERGAFTDARHAKAGLFETADGGTLFLDEIGFLSDGLQAKLLKVIEERTVRRLGTTRSRTIDVWIVAATSENLGRAMREGRFRPELYHRLAVFTLRVPPLRERGEDIGLLAGHFLARACTEYKIPSKTLSDAARAALQRYPWPGNIRELSNVIERSALLAGSVVLSPSNLALPDVDSNAPPQKRSAGRPGGEEQPTERERLLQALRDANWNLSAAAARLEIPRNTLRYRMERHGLRPPPPSRQRPARLDVTSSPSGPSVDTPPDNAFPSPVVRERLSSSAVRWERRRITLVRVDVGTGSPSVLDEAETSRGGQAAAQKLESFGGRIEEAGLTHVVASFGLTPMEDAARRAVLAAMAIQKAAERARRTTRARQGLKIAIDVADCLVGHVGDRPVIDADSKYHAASRLQSLLDAAEAGAVIVSDSASASLERRFELTALPGHPRGLVAAYVLHGPQRSGVGVDGRLTSFRGRQEELSLLDSRLDAALRGSGHIVALVGEAGIGKSRVVFEFRQRFATQPITYLEGRCSSHATAVPYAPVLDILRQLCDIGEMDAAGATETKVRETLRRLGVVDNGITAYLLYLLGVDQPEVRELTPQALKARIMDAIRCTIAAAARRQSCVVVLEDLHWIDTASDELVRSLIDAAPTGRLLLVLTYRPDCQPAWLARPYVTQMALAPLSPEDSRALLAAMSLPSDTVDLIVEKADGNPFFLEELARAIAEASGGDDSGKLPDTIYDVLMARIDRLGGNIRRLLQVGAVIGRTIAFAVLERMLDEAPSELRQHLRYLEAADFLRETRATPELEYTFKHALTQEVAYRSLSSEDRRVLHRKVAQVLVRLWPDIKDRHPERVARHLTAAEVVDEAVSLWLRAGRNAIRRSANVEAVSHLTTALDLLRRLPDNRERDQRELELQVTLGPALVMTKGYAAVEVEHVYQRARALCQRVENAPQLFRASRGVWLFDLVRGALRSAQETGEQLLATAAKSGQPLLLAHAHVCVGAPMFYRGLFTEARWHLEESVRHSEAAFDATPRHDGPDPMVVSLMFLGWTIGVQGDMDQALGCLRTATRRAEKLGHLFSLAAALNFAGFLHQIHGDFRMSGEYADRLVPIAREHHFSHLLGSGVWQRGRALAAAGQTDEGLRLMREGLTMLLASGGLAVTYYLGHAADTYRLAGDKEQATVALADAFAAAERNDENFYLPELYRVRGELLALDPSSRREAIHCLEQAVCVARRHGSSLLERRATDSLAQQRLVQPSGPGLMT